MTERHDSVRSEKSDVDPVALIRFLAALVVAVLVVGFGMGYLYRALAAHEMALQPSPPIMQFEAHRQPPGPNLQPLPAAELSAYRAEERRLLETYGWVDKSAGVVRIPIDEAMKRLLEAGLPVLPTASAGASADMKAEPK